MKRAVRVFPAVALGLIGLLSAAAPASAESPRIPLPTPDPVVLDGYCEGFTAVVTYTRFNQYIIRQTTAPDGTTTLKITGNAQVTVENQTTGKSVSYNISGPGTVVFKQDGSFSVDAGGPNLFWTLPENSFQDVPEISYTTGRLTFEVNPDGLTTSYNLAGRQTDVCAVLAAS